MQVISFCLYGPYNKKYYQGLLENLEIINITQIKTYKGLLEKKFKYLEKGYTCFIAPDDFKYKDFNEAICNGMTKEQINRTSFFSLPNLSIYTEFWPTESGECGVGPLTDNINSLIKGMLIEDFQIENYQSHPAIKAPLSN